MLFDALQQQCGAASEPARFIAEQHTGHFADYVQCKTCGQRRERLDAYIDVSLPIKAHRSVVDALRAFAAPETLDGANGVTCSSAQVRRVVQTQIYLERSHWEYVFYVLPTQENKNWVRCQRYLPV